MAKEGVEDEELWV